MNPIYAVLLPVHRLDCFEERFAPFLTPQEADKSKE